MQSRMETHIKVLSWLYIVLGVLGVISAGIVFLVVAGGGLISGDRTAIAVTSLVAIIISGFILLISAPGVVAGLGLLSYRPWARILTLILGILNLPGFPIGTLLGIYTIWALLDDESVELFNRRSGM
jgi:hypothetical protein